MKRIRGYRLTNDLFSESVELMQAKILLCRREGHDICSAPFQVKGEVVRISHIAVDIISTVEVLEV